MYTNIFLFLTRGVGVGISALGSIWVARTLGPEKLGISAFVFSIVNFICLATALSQDYNFVRRAKYVKDEGELDHIVSSVFSLRLGLSVAWVGAAFLLLLFWRPPATWTLAILAGIFLVLVQGNDAGWILQVRDRMAKYFIALSVQGILNGLLWVALIRSSWPAGSDLAIACVGAAFNICFAWWWACHGHGRIKVSFANFLNGFRYLRDGKWLILLGFGTYALTVAEVPLLGSLASVEDLGVYRSAMQLINVINPFVPLLFYRLYPKLIELQRDAPSLVLYEQWKASALVMSVGLPLIILAFFFAPLVYPLIYGERFAAGAMPFVILFSAKVVSVGVNVFFRGGFAQKLDRAIFLLTLGVAVMSLTSNVVLIPNFGMMAAAFVNLGSQIVLLLCGIALMVVSHRRIAI